MSRLLLLIGLVSVCFASAVAALDTGSALFYPLPTLTQGKVFIARNLYLADGGGVWIYDIHQRLFFFDGQTVVPRHGIPLSGRSQPVTYLNNAFWVVEDNALYRVTPPGERELVDHLPSGAVIRHLGASDGYLWFSNQNDFYTYDAANGEWRTYSLTSAMRFSQRKPLVINDAKRWGQRWLLATNGGVYLSGEQGFTHVKDSGQDNIEALLVSQTRNQLVMAGDNGALLTDLARPDWLPLKLTATPVAAMAEFDQEYWLATEKGLEVFSAQSGETVRLSGQGVQNYALPEGQVYALLNDQQGGMWIATDQGIRYFPALSQTFRRLVARNTAISPINSALKPLFVTRQGRDIVMNRADGLYRMTWPEDGLLQRIYDGRVNDLVEQDGVLWLATEFGLMTYPLNLENTGSLLLVDKRLGQPVQQLEIDSDGVLWGSSKHRLWSYDPTNGELAEFSARWQETATKPSVITVLKATQNRTLLIGTDQGVYRLVDQRLSYLKESANYGRSTAIAESATGEIWIAANYGLFRLDVQRNAPSLMPLPLVEDNLRLGCLIASREGMWLGSSKGLTLYRNDGQIARHFSAPYGLVNNELRRGGCAMRREGLNETLMFDSFRGLLSVPAKTLAHIRPPVAPLIVSQVRVDQQVRRFSALASQRVELDYGHSVSFQFGALPDAREQRLEYRLNQQPWQTLEGARLTLSQLVPGEHTLSLRRAGSSMLGPATLRLSLSVRKPWYLANNAILFDGLSLLAVIYLFSGWRARTQSAIQREFQTLLVASANQSQRSLAQLADVPGDGLQVTHHLSPPGIKLCWPQAAVIERREDDEHASSGRNDEQQWLARVEDLIALHCCDAEFSTAQAARHLYVSERSLQRRFKSATNKTFKEYLTECRLERARRLLLNGEKVCQVAYACGFNDPSYFSQRFKHHFGLSPTQYVATHQCH